MKSLLLLVFSVGFLCAHPRAQDLPKLDALHALIEESAGQVWHGIYLGGIKLGHLHTSCGVTQADGKTQCFLNSIETHLRPTIGLFHSQVRTEKLLFDSTPPYALCDASLTIEEFRDAKPVPLTQSFWVHRNAQGYTYQQGIETPSEPPELGLHISHTYPMAIAYRLLVRSKAQVGDRAEGYWLDLKKYVLDSRFSGVQGARGKGEEEVRVNYEVTSILPDGSFTIRSGDTTQRYGQEGWLRYSLNPTTGAPSRSGLHHEAKAIALSGFDAGGAWRYPVRFEGDIGPMGVAKGIVARVKGGVGAFLISSRCQRVTERAEGGVTVSIGSVVPANAKDESPKISALPEMKLSKSQLSAAAKLVESCKQLSGRMAISAMLSPLTKALSRAPLQTPSWLGRLGDDPLVHSQVLAHAGQSLGLDIQVVEGLVGVPALGGLHWHAWCEVKLDNQWQVVDPADDAVPSRWLHLACRRASLSEMKAAGTERESSVEALKAESIDTGVPNLSLFGDGVWWRMIRNGGVAEMRKMRMELARVKRDPDEAKLIDGRSSAKFMVPVALAVLGELAAQEQWNKADLDLATESALWVHEIGSGPQVKFSIDDVAKNRMQIRILGRWFAEQVKDPDQLASFIFTMDDGPFKGRAFDGDRSTLKSVTKINPEPHVTIELSRSAKGHSVLSCRTPKRNWSRILSRGKSQALPNLQFVTRAFVDGHECGKVLHLSDGEHLHLYCDLDWNFLFYFHSW